MKLRVASREEAASTRPLTAESVVHAYGLALLLAGILAALIIIFGQWSATSVWSFPRFLISILLLVYAPGKLIVDCAAIRLSRLEDLTLSMTLGMIVSSLLYGLSGFFAVRQLFLLWPLMAAVTLAYRRRGRWSELWPASLEARHLTLMGLIIVGLLPLAVLPMYYRNFSLSEQGTMTFSRGTPDVILHTAIANELTHSIPPQVPFIAGASLSYHYAMDLFVAMLSSTAGLSTLDLTVRFAPTLWITFTVLSVFCFSRAWLRSHSAALIATFLVMFGEDFSFIPGLLIGSPGIWSSDFFNVPTSFSLYFNNPMLPGLGALFVGLLCLLKFCEDWRASTLMMTSFIFALTIEYKAFVPVQVLLSLAITGVVWWLAFRDVRFLLVFAATALMTAPLFIYQWLTNEGGSGISVQLHHWPYIPHALKRLQLLDTGWGASVHAILVDGTVTPLGVTSLALIALPGYIVASLGLRTIAVPMMMKELVFFNRELAVRFFLTMFVVVGTVLTMTFTLTPNGLPYNWWYNNSVWFYVQGKYVMWVFVVELIAVWLLGKSWFWKQFVLIALIGLSVPSTLQFFGYMSRGLGALSENELGVVRALEQECSRGEVVFSPGTITRPIVSMTNCRVWFIEEYAPYFISVPEWRQRLQDQHVFWTAWGSAELRADMLERYEASYLVVDKRPGDPRGRSLPLEEWDPSPPEGGVHLERTFDNHDFALYRVVRTLEAVTPQRRT